MFIDICPGTPFIYRKDMLEKLLLTGYDIEDNVLWGVDSNANDYGADYALRIYEFDDKAFDDLQISREVKTKSTMKMSCASWVFPNRRQISAP